MAENISRKSQRDALGVLARDILRQLDQPRPAAETSSLAATLGDQFDAAGGARDTREGRRYLRQDGRWIKSRGEAIRSYERACTAA